MLHNKHKDYLLKKYEELGKVLGALLGFKEKGDNQAVVKEANRLLDKLLDEHLNGSELHDWLSESEWPTESLVTLADILQEKAEAEQKLGDHQQKETQLNAQTVAKFVVKERKTFPFHWAGRKIE